MKKIKKYGENGKNDCEIDKGNTKAN